MFFLCASLLPYAMNDNGAGLAGLDRVFRVQVCGCSSLQRPWGPAAIISHSFCPLPLSPAPALYTDDGLSEHSQKDTTKDCIVRPCSPWTFSTHTNAHSRCIRTQFYFVFLSSFFMWPYLFSLHSFQVYFGLVSEWGGVLEKWWAAHCERDWSDVQRRLDWRTADRGPVKHIRNSCLSETSSEEHTAVSRSHWVLTNLFLIHFTLNCLVSKFYFKCSEACLNDRGSVRRTCAWKPLESICIACEECFASYTNQLVLWLGLQLFFQA